MSTDGDSDLDRGLDALMARFDRLEAALADPDEDNFQKVLQQESRPIMKNALTERKSRALIARAAVPVPGKGKASKNILMKKNTGNVGGSVTAARAAPTWPQTQS